jgi:hypothetical protein
MSWKSFQNRNRQHKDNFQKELGEVEYKQFDDCDKEYYTFLYSLFMKITEQLPDKSEKEWCDRLQYYLQDLGFQTENHGFYFNCFYFKDENKICILSKSANPSLLFKLKQGCSSVIVFSLQDIKEYVFYNSGCVIRYL